MSPAARDQTPKRFVPLSLFPYGGFGDPDVDRPYFRASRNVDADNVLQAAAQDRIARLVRKSLVELEMSEAELEARLGYRKTGLIRKLNGNELLTMRDVVRLGTFFKGDLFVAFAAVPDGEGADPVSVVSDVSPSYRRDAKAEIRDLIADGAQRLREAAELLKRSGTTNSTWRAEALQHLSKVVLALGGDNSIGGNRRNSR